MEAKRHSQCVVSDPTEKKKKIKKTQKCVTRRLQLRLSRLSPQLCPTRRSSPTREKKPQIPTVPTSVDHEREGIYTRLRPPTCTSERVGTCIDAREHTKILMTILRQVIILWYCTRIRAHEAAQHLRARAHAQSRTVVCLLHALSPAARVGAESTASTSEPLSITTGFIFSRTPPRSQQ